MTEVAKRLPSTTLPEIAKEYNEAIREVRRYQALARSSKVQKQLAEKLTELKTRVRGYKYGAVQGGREDIANQLFHLQCALNAHISLLNLLRAIKAADYHKAWGLMIDAQEYISVAHRAWDDPDHLAELSERLDRIESVVFPGFALYNSIGTVIRGGTCTACDRPFGSCDHIEGRVYWGRLCVRVHWEVVKLDHTAIVEVPRDRRCIVTEISEDGWMLDNITRDRKKKIGPPNKGSIGTMAGVMFNTKMIEVT